MESNDELKEIDIKDCMCYYFYDIIKIEDFDFGNILKDEKSCENTLVYNILFKTLVGSKPLCIRFDKRDGFVRVYDEIRYLALFSPEEYEAIYDVLLVKKMVLHILFLIISQD